MFKRFKRYQARRKELAALRAYIDRIKREELATAKTEQERYEARQAIYTMTREEENELLALQQEDLIAALHSSPLIIPDEYWNDVELWETRTLNVKGQQWARYELKKLWKAEVEFWAKLVLPVVALVISIIALMKKSH